MKVLSQTDSMEQVTKYKPKFIHVFFVGAALPLLFCAQARALPEYSVKEKKQCGYCHYDHNGGGPTNARGRYYAKHRSLKGYFDKVKAASKSPTNSETQPAVNTAQPAPSTSAAKPAPTTPPAAPTK